MDWKSEQIQELKNGYSMLDESKAHFGLDFEIVLHFDHFLLVLFELRFQIDIFVLELLDVLYQLGIRALNRLYFDLELFDLQPKKIAT